MGGSKATFLDCTTNNVCAGKFFFRRSYVLAGKFGRTIARIAEASSRLNGKLESEEFSLRSKAEPHDGAPKEKHLDAKRYQKSRLPKSKVDLLLSHLLAKIMMAVHMPGVYSDYW